MAHTGEKMCYTAEVFIVFGDKVLLRRHRKFNSIWLSIGGHIEPGEDPTETAKREVKEEVGLDILLYDGLQRFHTVEPQYRDLIPPIAVARHTADDSHEHIILVYFATSTSDKVIPETPTDEWVWATRDELDRMDLVPNVREYAIAALEELAQ